MPSGSKKRKAAKKKKEKGANNSTTHSHEDQDLKVHDEKESVGGEANSPASQDHHNHQHRFTEGEEEGMEQREDISSVRSMVTESESMVGVNSNGDSTEEMAVKEANAQIDWELKHEADSDGKNGSIEYVESVKESHGGRMSHDGGRSSSSSSSSDDESHVIDKNIVMIEYRESKEDALNSVAESDAFEDVVKIARLPEITPVTDGVSIIDDYNLAVDEPKEEAYDTPSVNLVRPADLPEVTEVTDSVLVMDAYNLAADEPKEQSYDAPSVNLVKPVDLPEVAQLKDDVPVIETYSLVVGKLTEETYNSVVETIPVVGSENVSKEVVRANDSSTVESAICSNLLELGLKENGKNDTLGVLPVVMDMGSQPKKDKVILTAVESSAVSSVATASSARVDEDKLFPSSSVPAVDNSNGADLIKDSVITEASDSQHSFGSVGPTTSANTILEELLWTVGGVCRVTGWIVTGERQAERIRRLYLKTILRQDIAFFDTETTTREVIGRMSGDTILIQDAMGEKVGKFIQLMSTFIGGFAIAFARGWLLSLVLLTCIPALVIAGGGMAIIMTRMSSRGQVAYAEAGNVVEQTVGGASFTGEKLAINKYNSKLQIAYAATTQQGLASGIGLGTMLVIIFSSYGLAIWYGSKLIIDKGYNGGVVINVIMAIMTGGMSLGQTSPCLNSFAAGQAAAYKMFETIKRKPQIDVYDTSGIAMEDIKGEIELKDVHFRYPARPDVQIFSGFSLQVPSGTTTALVGQSGSGKSTVISLLQRFYDPEAGEVLIDGINLKKFQLKWIREKMGLVSQEPILFGTTIGENIAYGKENATNEEIRTAIELANAAKFIDKLPKGLDTMVGEHGSQLSGRQKQRIAIARAILKNPKILLLDEATSALDAESERVVQDALTNIMSSRTTVVVAHRLTTIRNADLIAVVQEGKIVERGTHGELIKDPEGAYSQLIRLQEGTNKVEDPRRSDIDNLDTIQDVDITMGRSASQILSMRRSISRGSSGSQRSFRISFGLHGPIGIQTDIEGEESSKRSETDDKKRRQVSIKRLMYLNKPELPVLLLGSIAAGINGVTFPIFGLLLSTAIKIFYEPHDELRKDSRFWALMFVGLGVVILFVAPVQNYFFGIAGGRLIMQIRALMFEKAVHQEISWFDNPKNSRFGARLSTDALTVRSLVGDSLAQIVQNITTIIAGLVISFTANWMLALIILSVLPLVGLQGFFQIKFLKGFIEDAKVMYEDASQVANDAVGSIRTVASFCAEKKVIEMYKNKCEAPMKHGVRIGLVSGIGFGSSLFALYCTNAFCFYIGAVLVQHGKATFGEVFKVFFALTISAMGVSQTTALAPDTNKAKDSAASIFEIIDSKPKIDSSSNEGTTLATITGDIEFKHVSFNYPTRPDVQIFRDLCLTIPSGKSTVISLIERFYDPESGHIFLDGVEIQKLKLSWLRQQMGLVSQEPVLFNETIWTNIAYGKQGEAAEEEIIAAAKAANVHNFISALPHGYDTNVGERGVQLSGGQKQRIAIVRAIVKDPKTLLLDEATSALDAESERVVQDALDRVMMNRTTIVVAHRLTTIRCADVIAVVKNGVIAEKGTHDVLMKITDGAYASLVALHMASSK
ncbi:unnamed protein product [Camellia sinensis]